MKSVMTHNFSQVPNVNIPRSVFDRSCGCKTTFDAGYLIPVYCDIALPGDTFALRMSAFARMATPIYPIMDNIKLRTFFFSVPLRIIFDNFKRMMGEQDNPADSIDYILPTMTSPAVTGYLENSLHDYLGIPTKVIQLEHNSIFHRAYNRCYFDWFRDQNLIDAPVLDTDDGPDDPADYVLRRIAKSHDYFTSALPWPVKGGVEIDLPLGTIAPVAAENISGTDHTGAFINQKRDATSSHLTYTATYDTAGTIFETGTEHAMYADLSSATAATINQLREAFQLQRMLEKDARGGTRYNELVLSHFRVTIPDYRVQRSEYLGGGVSYINVNPVPATTNNASTEVGLLGAYATSALNGHGFTKSFTEHSVIIGMVAAQADLTYQQGLNRMFSISTRYDFYWPSLSGLGEQAILNKEIYAQGLASPTEDADVFGYIPRWDEYRYKPSIITGQFRSNHSTPLDSWHLSQEFSSLPALNQTFIEENPPIDRVIATPDEPHFIFDSFFKLRCARPMPMFGVPGMIDHF